MNSVLDSPNGHWLMSLASRIKAIHRALTAEELAGATPDSPRNDSPAGKAGQHTVISSRLLREIRLCCNRQVANATRRAENVQTLRQD